MILWMLFNCSRSLLVKLSWFLALNDWKLNKQQNFHNFKCLYASKVILYYERHMMVQSMWNTLQIEWNVYKTTQVDNVWCIQNTWSPRVSHRKPIQEQAQPALECFCDSLPIFKECFKPHWPSFWCCVTSVLASTIVTSKFHALKELRNAEGESCIHWKQSGRVMDVLSLDPDVYICKRPYRRFRGVNIFSTNLDVNSISLVGYIVKDHIR